MRRKIGLNIDCIKDGSKCENILKLKEAGFDCFFVLAIREDVDKYKKISEDVGIYFEFIHAPFRGINAIWEEGDEYATLFDQMMETVDAAADYGVPTVIIHLSSGWNPPEVNELGLKRYDKLVAHATEKKINIAFENLRNVENVLVIKERYKDNPYVGFCYDAGHEHCYTDNFDWIETFGDKLLCTHIHDNDGIHDSHTLPYYGNIAWEGVMKALAEVGYSGNFNYEAALFVKRAPIALRQESANYMAAVGKHLIDRYRYYKGQL